MMLRATGDTMILSPPLIWTRETIDLACERILKALDLVPRARPAPASGEAYGEAGRFGSADPERCLHRVVSVAGRQRARMRGDKS